MSLLDLDQYRNFQIQILYLKILLQICFFLQTNYFWTIDHSRNFRSWAKAKQMMAKVDPFLESLIHYEKENIHPNIIIALDPYLKDKEFDPDFIRTKSGAAAGK